MAGTGRVNIEPELSSEGELLFRTTIVADATGYLALNGALTAEVRRAQSAWLDAADDT